METAPGQIGTMSGTTTQSSPTYSGGGGGGGEEVMGSMANVNDPVNEQGDQPTGDLALEKTLDTAVVTDKATNKNIFIYIVLIAAVIFGAMYFLKKKK